MRAQCTICKSLKQKDGLTIKIPLTKHYCAQCRFITFLNCRFITLCKYHVDFVRYDYLNVEITQYNIKM